MDPDSPGAPVIAAIRSLKRRRHRLVELSDGRQFVVTDEALSKVGLVEGQAAGPELFDALEVADQRAAAHEAALRLLATRARSEREMRTRLSMRGYEPGAIDAEVERLLRAGLLDDGKFAHAWVEERKQNAPRGRRMLRYELLGRGISPEAVDEATRDINDRELAFELARKKSRFAMRDDLDSFLARVGSFLRRKGFDYELAAEAARTAWHEAREAGAGGQ